MFLIVVSVSSKSAVEKHFDCHIIQIVPLDSILLSYQK